MFKRFTFSLLVLTMAFSVKGQNGYNIKVTVKGLAPGTKCILANYYGGNQYKQDSAIVNDKNTAIFKGDTKLAEGVYIFFPEKQKYFDFIMDKDQQFSLEADSADYVGSMKIKDSPENTFFYGYQKFMMQKRKEAEPLSEQYKKIKDTDKAKAKEIADKLAQIDKETKQYMLDFIKNNPKTFTAKIFQTIQEPEIPETPILPNGQKDSTFAYRYYKAHFFDHFDFSDERLLYTPIFHNKIKQYLDKLTIQSIDPPDSLNAAVDFIAKKAEANPEIFKYLINWMTYTYESSKIMGQEAVFVHLVEQNHMKGKTPWVDSVHLYKVTDKAINLKWSLIGARAYPIVMKDTAGNVASLYETKAKYTVLVIWDFDCGHCKKEIPELHKIYEEKLKAKGVKVFAVEGETPAKGWNKFVKEYNLNWINAGETDDYKRAVIKKAYDVYSTPTMYLLDENKIIKAKRLGIDQIDGYIDHLEKIKKK